MKEWFKAKNIWGAALDTIEDDAAAGKLMKALWHYTMYGVEDELPPELKGYFVMMVLSLKQDEAENRNISKVRSEAGAKGGNQRAANQTNITVECSDEESEQNVANVANATNKNKSKKRDIDKKENTLTGVREKMFEQFWSAYPRHEGKQNAQRAFDKLNVDEELLAKILSAIERQKQSSQWKENGGQYIPHPATWLNGHRWEDEVQEYRPTGRTVIAQQYTQRDYSGEDEAAFNDMIARIKEEKAKQAEDDEDAEAYRRMLRKAVEEDALP